RGLGNEGGGHQMVGNLDDRPDRVHHVEVNDRVHLDGDVVLGDDLLGRHVHGDGAKVDLVHLVDEGNEHAKAGALHVVGIDAAQTKDDASLVLVDDTDRFHDEDQHE